MQRIAPAIARLSPRPLLRAAILAFSILSLFLAIIVRMTAPPSNTTPSLIGQPAPVFTLVTVNANGSRSAPTSLQQEHGHPLLLVFFSSLCIHCLNEAITVQQIEAQPRYQNVQSLYIDSPAESTDIVSAYQQRVGIASPVLLDTNGNIAARYGIHYFPTVIVVDSVGVVRNTWSGETSLATLERALSILPLTSDKAIRHA